MARSTENKIWLGSLILALASNAVATTLTIRYDNGTSFVETNRLMALEISLFGRWVPIMAGLMLAGLYCGIWYFTIRRPVSSDMKRFMSFILFFIPALTIQDAIGDVSIVFAGIPLIPLQGIQFSAAVYASAFVLSQLAFRKRKQAAAAG